MTRMGLRARLLSTVLADLPQRDSVLREPSARLDELYGGRKDTNNWGRYGRNYGTTCGVTVAGWLISVGADPQLINADVPEGSGFKIGDHIIRVNNGAARLGWLRTPTKGELPTFRPGDLYEINHLSQTPGDNTHIGVVLKVVPSADGQSLEVDTADGGQGTRADQTIGRRVRTFRLGSGGHAVTVSTPGVGDGWLDRWVAIGGDEADDVPPVGTDGVAQDVGVDVGVVGLGVLGLGLLVAGVYAAMGPPPSPPQLLALRTPASVDAALRRRMAARYLDEARGI